ncbi:mannose-1-phosphate guanylyltransferase [Rhodohalobacter halophilus]|uniref:mannose-1-phosphate guanylyltransferase n=1 Tax=Rhodohalobacter halophilus TaxID=1812810 RepID=UPI00083FA613|nr:mannose-1-phosphate guanylyltransferase [Rhodohalobacter halophilus]
MTYAVIMAGGSGTRFWPKSTKALPKQFLNLFGEKTMIQETVARLKGAIETENVLVVTNDNYVPIVKRQLPEVPEKFIIGEPVAKNTAPCVAAAAAIMNKMDPDSVMVVLPADHQIKNEKAFLNILNTAIDTAKREDSLVTIGIQPNRPETGYGYICYNEKSIISVGENPVYSVKNFTEKPDRKTADKFLSDGNYLWNSGMFIWKTETILNAFKKYLPEVFKLTEKLQNSDLNQEDINQFYQACPSISIDYGIMEKAEKVHVVPGEFGWNDVGSWTAVHELSEKDDNGNAIGSAKICFVDSSQNLVQTDSGKLVSLVGVDNVAVVETKKAILVVNLKKAQGVKQVVEELKSNPDLKEFL